MDDLKPCYQCGTMPEIEKCKCSGVVMYHCECKNKKCKTNPRSVCTDKEETAVSDWNRFMRYMEGKNAEQN